MERQVTLVGVRMPRDNQQPQSIQACINAAFPEHPTLSFSYAGPDLEGRQGAFYSFVTDPRTPQAIEDLMQALSERISAFGAALISASDMHAIHIAHDLREAEYCRSLRSDDANQTLDELQSFSEGQHTFNAMQARFVRGMVRATTQGEALSPDDLCAGPFQRMGNIDVAFVPDELQAVLSYQNLLARQASGASVN